MKMTKVISLFLTIGFSVSAQAVLPPEVKTQSSQELDLSGFSKLESAKAPGSPVHMKANCSSRYVGTYNSDEQGFDACLSELEQAKFQQNSRNPGNRNQPAQNGPSLEFKSEVDFN